MSLTCMVLSCRILTESRTIQIFKILCCKVSFTVRTFIKFDKLVESLRLHEEDLKIIDLKYYKCQKRKEKLISFFFGR